MSRRALIAIVLLIFGGSLLARWIFLTSLEDVPALPEPTGLPERIISMAPSITETLFALGLGDRVVGVTRYCLYPPEARTKAEVGGFLDPNYEAVVTLEPDLAVLLSIHGEAKERLADLGIPTLTVEHRTLDGIIESFGRIAEACGPVTEAQALRRKIVRRMERVRTKTRNAERPRVLLSSARELGTGRLGTVYAAGKNQWYDDLIELAGGENAFQDESVQFPALSGEGLLRLNPDIVIELAPELQEKTYTREDLVNEWAAMKEMTAVQAGRVYVLDGDHLAIPGPRFVQTLEDIARVVHPEIDWSAP